MSKTPLSSVLPFCFATGLVLAPVFSQEVLFEAPVRLKADGQYIKTESPGYASPCWADVDGDGKKDLIVGQFSGGKMKVYRNLGDGKLAKGEWLKAEGEVAEVPGVW
jgi:FG-GAP-like repeat